MNGSSICRDVLSLMLSIISSATVGTAVLPRCPEGWSLRTAMATRSPKNVVLKRDCPWSGVVYMETGGSRSGVICMETGSYCPSVNACLVG